MNRNLQRRLVARYLAEPVKGSGWPTSVSKTAAFPFQKEEGGGTGLAGQRSIPKDHPFDPSALKPMAKALWAASVSLGHALTAQRYLSRLKSATVSPDGMLGGRGYVMGMADLRKRLSDACETLSAITDTLHDEIHAPHWKPRLAQLDQNEAEDIERFIEESQGILENPEEDAEEEARQIEEENDGEEEEEGEEDSEDFFSQIPSEDSISSLSDKSDKPNAGIVRKTSSVDSYDWTALSNSSIPVGALPGPRVEHLDREDSDRVNPLDAYPEDGWGTPSEREYAYPSPWSDGHVVSQSGLPDSSTDPTGTEGFDFGLGYGARGQGPESYNNPSGEGNGTKGVYGPASGLPGTPSQSSGDTTPRVDVSQNERRGLSFLPGDLQEPVARSDYYRGDRGNLINTNSELPVAPASGGEFDKGLLNTDYTYEDVSTPYVRYDYSTHTYRDDNDE